MENKELVNEKLGEIGSVELAIKDDKLDLELDLVKGPFKFVAKVELDAVAVAVAALQWLKVKIPGQIDDAIIDGAVALLQKKDA